MTTTPVYGRAALQDPMVQLVLGRSAVYEALSLAFAHPEPEVLERLTILLEDLEDHAITRLFGLQPRITAIREALAAASTEELSAEHVRLFRGQVLCSPHETEYERDSFAKASQLADIAGFYQAWGMQTSNSHRSMPDFVGTELEFMALVTRKQVYATARSWPTRRALAIDAAHDFLNTHLSRWVHAFAQDVRAATDESSAGHYFAAVARMLEQFVVMDISANGLPLPQQRERLVHPDADESMVCLFDDPSATVDPETEGMPLIPPI